MMPAQRPRSLPLTRTGALPMSLLKPRRLGAFAPGMARANRSPIGFPRRDCGSRRSNRCACKAVPRACTRILPVAPPPAGREHVEWRVHKQHGCAARASHRRRTRGRSSNSPCSSPSNRLRRFVSKVNSPAYVDICMAVPGPTYAASEKLASEIFSGAIRSARANDGFSELDNRSSPTPQTSGGDRTGSKFPDSPTRVGIAHVSPTCSPAKQSNPTIWSCVSVCRACVCVCVCVCVNIYLE